MNLNKISDIETFLKTVKTCKGRVELVSTDGDVFNLKSEISGYIGMRDLIDGFGYRLDLRCSDREDEAKLMKMFIDNPDMI